MATHCLGRNRDDTPCSAYVKPGQTFCQWHAPELADQRREWSRRGGQNRSNRARARRELTTDAVTLRDAGLILGRLLRKLEDGQTEPAVVSAASAAVRALASLEQVTAFEERLTELERVAGIERSA